MTNDETRMTNFMSEAYMHEIQLPPMGEAQINRAIGEQRESDVVHAVLHLLRSKSAEFDRIGRQSPKIPDCDPLEWRAYHAGAAGGCEELFWKVLALTVPQK